MVDSSGKNRAAGLDRAGMAALYAERAEDLLRFFVRQTLDPQIAADLTAETFAVAVESMSRFDPSRGEPGAWLFGIGRHLLSGWARRRVVEDAARRRLGFVDQALSQTDLQRVEALIDFAELGRRVRTVLGELPATQRDAVSLRVVSELSYAQIAEQLGCSEQAARLRVLRGLRELGLRLTVTQEQGAGG